MRSIKLLPFLSWFGLLDRPTLRADFAAGVTGAIVVLPQGVAFALIAGLPAQHGLYTAIVVTMVAALFGSSRHLVSGPTTAISIVVLTVVGDLTMPGSPDYLAYVLTLTFLAGLIQLLLGMAGMGSLVNFVSHTVIIGFTAGAAVLIAASQLPHFLGLAPRPGLDFPASALASAQALNQLNPYALFIACLTLITALLIRHWRPHWPALLFAMLAGSVACYLSDGAGHGVPLVGALPSQLPPPSLPNFSAHTIRELVPGALAVAVLGLIEAVSIARSVATRSHQRIDSNQEFVGQGLSNIVGSFFSCYAGAGSFTRTGINFDAGARTPLAAIIAALALAVVLWLLAPLTAYLPLPAMAGVIMLVAWQLIDTRSIGRIFRAGRRELAILTTTLLATLLFNLEFAIVAGMLLSLIFYLQRTSHPRITAVAPNPARLKSVFDEVKKQTLKECPQLKIIRLDGSLFFGAVNHVQRYLHRLPKKDGDWQHILILGGAINFIDLAGAELLVQEARRIRQTGGHFYLCGLKDSVRAFLNASGYAENIGRDNIFTSKEEAIRRIFEQLDHQRCRRCDQRIFRECSTIEFDGEKPHRAAQKNGRPSRK